MGDCDPGNGVGEDRYVAPVGQHHIMPINIEFSHSRASAHLDFFLEMQGIRDLVWRMEVESVGMSLADPGSLPVRLTWPDKVAPLN